MDESGRYRIAVSGGAKRSLRRLPEKVATAIVEFITGPLADNPFRLSKPLVYEYGMYRTARRGHYRVLFEVDEESRTIIVAYIDHRADVYRPR